MKLCVILIGIRYDPNSKSHLKGCHNDIKNIYNFINKSNTDIDYYILADSMIPICGNEPNIHPSKQNILNIFEEVRGKYNNYFIHYSGHGTQIKCLGEEESDDGLDEVICPYDYQTKGIISDDILNREFLQHLTKDCCVRILMDCCRSGTVWDLSYTYNYERNSGQTNVFSPILDCDVIVLSGCKDNEYSYDVVAGNEPQGAFTYCALQSLGNTDRSSIFELCKKINEKLKSRKWNQTCVISSSHLLTDRHKFDF